MCHLQYFELDHDWLLTNINDTARVSLLWELAILASQRACMRVVIRGLVAVLLEFPAHPASVADSDSISNVSLSKQKAHHKGELFVLMVETAGIEPASASPLQAVLHT